MAAKKTNAADILAKIGAATTSANTDTEKAARKQGHKPGTPAKWGKRLNIGVTEELKEYLQIMSKLRGISLNDFINEILQHSYEDNKELFEKCRDLAKSIDYKSHNAITGKAE